MESLFIFKIAIEFKHLQLILLLIGFSSAILLTSVQWLHNITTENPKKKEGGEGAERAQFPSGQNSSRTL